jgi:hypothetical protein
MAAPSLCGFSAGRSIERLNDGPQVNESSWMMECGELHCIVRSADRTRTCIRIRIHTHTRTHTRTCTCTCQSLTVKLEAA